MAYISTSGITSGSIIQSEHLLRIIDALSSTGSTTIGISGPLQLTGSFNISGSAIVQDNSGTPYLLRWTPATGLVSFFTGSVATSGNTIPPATGATLSSTFATAPAILLKMVDANGCEKIELLECRFGCSFLITIQEGSCVTDITIQSSSCDVGGLAIVEASCVTTLAVTDPTCDYNLVTT